MVKSVYSAGRIYSRSVIGYTQHQSSVWSAKVCPVNDRSRCRVDFLLRACAGRHFSAKTQRK